MNKRRHFHTFDALRFFAFLKVFLLHIPFTTFPVFNFLKKGGGIGVTFFFVLSGFLISYIILEEKQRTGLFNLKNFFVRRILRIWPLFYLMILIAYLTPYLASLAGLTTSADGYSPNWLMSSLFLENYKMMFSHEPPNVSPLGVMWSLCIEEHFYIIWGLILFFLPLRKMPILIISALLVGNISRAIYFSLGYSDIDIFSNIDYFAYGSIPAYLLITKKENLTSFICNLSIYIKTAFIIVLLLYLILAPNISYLYQRNLEPVIFGLFFSGLLFLIIPEKNKIKLSDNNIFSRLGKYTYGLYVYHTIIINFLFQLYRSNNFMNTPINVFIFSAISLSLTIGISFLSYNLFEKQFLKLKQYFY